MERNQAEKTRAELEKLDGSIRWANRAVIFWIGLWGVVYFGWFWFNRGAKPPLTPASWGVMGDFFGGFLNPVVAYSAFFWLTKSVRLQKEELAETRQALADSAKAQDEQVKLASKSVRLNALNTLSNSIMTEVATQRTLLQFYVDQLRALNRSLYDIEGNYTHESDFKSKIAALNQVISDRMLERNVYEREIKQILETHVG